MHRIPAQMKPYPLGWRAKLGLLVPSHDSGYGTYELVAMSPNGVVTLETRVPGRTVVIDELQSMVDNAVTAAALVADAHPDIIDFIPTAPCFVIGVEKETALVNAITERTGIQATSGGRAVSDALRAVGASRIIMYTPYVEAVQELTDTYFADQGFEVLGVKALKFADPESINRVPPYDILSDIVRLAKAHPDADGVFVVGGCFRTLDIVEQLEELIGMPVVGTQQANMFQCLRLTGVDEQLEGFGRLLAIPNRSSALA